MVTAKRIVKGIFSAFVAYVVLRNFWLVLPKTGAFSTITWIPPAVFSVVIGFVIVGPGRVVGDTLSGDYWE
jgi:hypothetical protein